MIEIKNLDRVLKSVEDGKRDFHNALIVGLREGLRRYERFVMMDMLSGRKGNYGLNVKTGIAKNSLDVNVSDLGKDIVGNLSVAKRAWYLKVHQHEGFSGWVQPKKRKVNIKNKARKFINTKRYYIPKRLFIYERFKTKGKMLIESSLQAKINKI